MPRNKHYQIGGDAEDVRVSRSQKKRESTALQATGELLARMPASRRLLLPLPQDLKDALEDYDRLSGFEAKRRQLQFIGRLMRESQEEGTLQPLLDALARLE